MRNQPDPTLSASRNRRLRAVQVAVIVLALLGGLVSPTAAVPASATGSTFVDTFTRADNWQIGSAETGQAWQVWSGTAVVAGQAAAANAAGYTIAVAESGTASGSVALSVPVISDEFWMVFRATNSGNYWRFGRWAGGAYQLQQIAGWALGSPQVVVDATITPTNGDRIECRLASGVTCLVNGTTTATTSDGFNGSATMVGFAMADGAGIPVTRIDDIEVVPPPPAADVRVDVTAVAGTVAAGAPVSWTATATNVGTLMADGVQMTASLPTAVTNATGSWPAGTCVAGAQLVCNFGSLAPGQSVPVTVSGVAPSQPQDVTLSIAVSSATPDADLLNNQAASLVTVEAAVPTNAVVVDNFTRPDSYSMGAAPTGQTWQVWSGTARVAGQRALASEPGYTMSVIDAGTTNGSVIVSVPSISSDYWVIARASNSGNYWRFGRSAGGGYELQQVKGWAFASPPIDVLNTVVPAAGDQLECRFVTGITCYVNGIAVASSADPFQVGSSFVGFAAYGASAAPGVRFDDFRATTALPAPDLVVAVVAASSTVVAGGLMSWTATVTNAGTLTATGVTTSTTAPAGLPTFAAASSRGSCSAASGLHTCAIGSLAAGAAATVTFSATAPSTIGSFSVRVNAGPVDSDGDLSTNWSSASIRVRVLALPGQFVTDGFNRPNAATLGQTEQGRPWEMLQGSMGVVSNQAAKTDSGSGLSMALIDPGFTFGTMQVQVASGATSGFYILFRVQDANNYYRLGPDAAGNYRVEKMLNGRLIGLQFNAIRANVRAANGDRIRLVTRPDDGWFISINGVHVLDGGDVDLYGQFNYGLAASSPNVRFDGLSISQTISTGITTVESFNHPAESHLELRTPTSGTVYTWLTPQGYWVTRNGSGVMDSPGFGLARLETSSQLARVRVTVRSSKPEAWLVFRHDDGGSHYRFGYDAVTRRYNIERIGPNGETLAVPGGVTISTVRKGLAGDRLEVRQSTDGTIRGYVNGGLIATAKDSVNGMKSTAYGFAGEEGATFDDFNVTPPQ